MLLPLKRTKKAKLTEAEVKIINELISLTQTPRGISSLVKRVGDCVYPTIYPYICDDGILSEGLFRLRSDKTVKVTFCDQGYILVASIGGYGFPTYQSQGHENMIVTSGSSAYLADMLNVPDVAAFSEGFDCPVYVVKGDGEALKMVSGFYRGFAIEAMMLENMILSPLLKDFPW